MTDKVTLIKVSAVLIVLIGGAQLALAGSVPPQASQPNATTTMSGPVSRPGNYRNLGPLKAGVASPLTENECTGLGGTTAPIVTSQCSTGKKCVVADKDGVMRAACITKK